MRLEREFENLMERFLGPEEGRVMVWGGFAPTLNVAESEEAFEVTVELPGMKAGEVQVEMKNGDLWISGEKKEEKEEKGKTFHRIERHHGEFRRVVPFVVPVAEEKISAEF
jgi:HSP20 family protein